MSDKKSGNVQKSACFSQISVSTDQLIVVVRIAAFTIYSVEILNTETDTDWTLEKVVH